MLLKFYADASWSEWEQSLIAANDVREPQVKNLYFFFFLKPLGLYFMENLSLPNCMAF